MRFAIKGAAIGLFQRTAGMSRRSCPKTFRSCLQQRLGSGRSPAAPTACYSRGAASTESGPGRQHQCIGFPGRAADSCRSDLKYAAWVAPRTKRQALLRCSVTPLPRNRPTDAGSSRRLPCPDRPGRRLLPGTATPIPS